MDMLELPTAFMTGNPTKKMEEREIGLLHAALLAVYQWLDTASLWRGSQLTISQQATGCFLISFPPIPSTKKAGHADSFSPPLAPSLRRLR